MSLQILLMLPREWETGRNHRNIYVMVLGQIELRFSEMATTL